MLLARLVERFSNPGVRGWAVDNAFDSETWEVLAGNEQTEILA